MTGELPNDKSAFRGLAKARRQALTAAQTAEWSQKLRDRLQGWPVFLRAECVGLYAPLPGEPDLMPLVPLLLSRSKQVALPRVSSAQMEFIAFRDLKALRTGSFGILEPYGPDAVPINPDLILVPGLGFDRFGTRLGFGKGYYDRFLPLGAILAGICFENAVFEQLPVDPHDRPIDFFVTEKQIYKTNL